MPVDQKGRGSVVSVRYGTRVLLPRAALDDGFHLAGWLADRVAAEAREAGYEPIDGSATSAILDPLDPRAVHWVDDETPDDVLFAYCEVECAEVSPA